MSNEDVSRNHSQLGPNSFPKINGKLREFIHQLQKLKDEQRLPQIVSLLGTVKLHGMHADIVFDLEDKPKEQSIPSEHSIDGEHRTPDFDKVLQITNDDSSTSHVRFQSRNLLCAPQSSQHGWPKDVVQFPDALTYLKNRILTQYTSRYPGAIIDCTKPLIVAGEWIGQGVKKDVGISQLSPRFVILGIKLNDMWLADDDWHDIEANKAGIFTIHRVPPFKVEFDTSDISETNHVLLDMQRITDEVEACCPYAAHFGIPDSLGEGIVWKINVLEGMTNPKCWFKTKGPISGPQNRIDVESIAAQVNKRANVHAAVESWITPQRVEQGFEYLLEHDLTADKEGLKQFVDWMVRDILTEEEVEIEEMRKLFPDARRLVKSEISRLARKKYFEEMKVAETFVHQ